MVTEGIKMLDKLKSAEARYDEVNMKLSDPAVISDNGLYRELMREQKNLTPLIEKYREYKKCEKGFEDAEAALEDSDPELRDMAREEYALNKRLKEELTEELKILLLPRDPDDDRNVIVEIRGGAGGEEAALFANSMFRMYSMYAAGRGWRIEVISSNPTELGGYKEICFSVEGEGAYARLKYESGVHRVQRVPETESQGRIQTSTITVAVLPEVEEVDVDINPADLTIQTYRSSGAGGQHINKTDSAIRITHFPTGIVVTCQDQRSQTKNKERAMQVLATKLYDYYQGQKDEEYASLRKGQVGTGDRSERIRTYNFPQGRVTDHRIGYTLYSIDEFMNGDLDKMVEALRLADQTRRLEGDDAR